MNDSLNDTELERLLEQLLRAVSPAAAADAAEAQSQARGTQAGVTRSAAGAAAGEQVTARLGAATGGGLRASVAGAAGPSANGTAAMAELAAMSASEARALIELIAARGIAQGELAGLLGLEKSTVSRLAAGLERKGWIERGRDEGDLRYVRLFLTDQGRMVAARVLDAWQSRQARILDALTPEERVGLSAGLRGLLRGLAAEGLLSEPAPAGKPRPGGHPAPPG